MLIISSSPICEKVDITPICEKVDITLYRHLSPCNHISYPNPLHLCICNVPVQNRTFLFHIETWSNIIRVSILRCVFCFITNNVSIFYIDFTLVTFLLIVSLHTYFGNAPNFGQMHSVKCTYWILVFLSCSWKVIN